MDDNNTVNTGQAYTSKSIGYSKKKKKKKERKKERKKKKDS